MRTFGQQEAKLRDEIPGIGPNESRRRIQKAYQDLNSMNEWQHRYRTALLAVDASYNTGTLTVTQNAAGVTLAGGGVWSVAWTTSPSSRKILISGRPEVFDITVTGAATGTLAENWLGDTSTTATYIMFRDEYPLPADCDYGRAMLLYDRVNDCVLLPILQNEMIIAKMESVGSIGVPQHFCQIGQTSETPPRPQILLGPEAPEDAQNLILHYFSKPSAATAFGDYPEWPERYEDAIWLMAAVDYYSSPRNFGPRFLGDLRSRLGYILSEMRRTMDGQKFMLHQIQSVRLTDSSRTITFVPRVV